MIRLDRIARRCAMAAALLELETIDADQINDIMAGRTPQPPKDWTPRIPPSGDGPSGGTPAVVTAPTAARSGLDA